MSSAIGPEVAEAVAFAGIKARWSDIQAHFNEGVRDFNSLLAVAGGIEGLALGGGAEAQMIAPDIGTGTRYMGSDEAAEVGRTGTIPNMTAQGEPKIIHFTTDDPLMSALDAKNNYGLPTTPTHVCQFPLCNVANSVPPDGAVASGASQSATSQPIHGAATPVPIKP